MADKSVQPDKTQGATTGPSIDERTGQPIEEAEDNLSRHTTRDSSPPVSEQGRTTERIDENLSRSGQALKEQSDGAGE